MFHFSKLGTYSSSPGPFFLSWRIPGYSHLPSISTWDLKYSTLKTGLIISHAPSHPPSLSTILHPHQWPTRNSKIKLVFFPSTLYFPTQAIKKFCWFWSLISLTWPLLSVPPSLFYLGLSLFLSSVVTATPLRMICNPQSC